MKVITCFSYKGGSGRTTAAANIAAALASTTKNVGSIEEPLKRKVALIDLDVFSAGTHRVFEIKHEEVNECKYCIQDYLRQPISAADFVKEGGITLEHPYMEKFRVMRGAADNCRPEFTLFPAKPDPDARFAPQKQHENVLIELLMELESKRRNFDYVVLDGESGTRQMADIGLRLADVILMFFRLTWQHIEGSLNTAKKFLENKQCKPFYLIPTCVPLVQNEDHIYLDNAPGLAELRELTKSIPYGSGLNAYADEQPEGAGHFWADVAGGLNRSCIHESLLLKGAERIMVYDFAARNDRTAGEYYRIAAEINRRHAPSA